MPSVRPTGCASQLPGPGREVNDRTPSAPSAPRRVAGSRRSAQGSPSRPTARCGASALLDDDPRGLLDSLGTHAPAPARERRSESKAAAERRGGRRRHPRGPRKGGQEGATAKGRVRRQLPAQQERGGASRERARGRSAHLTPAAASASSPRWFTALQCERCEQSPGVRLFFTFLPTYPRLQATETFCLLHSI